MGQKRMRSCASKKAIIDEQRWKEMERRLDFLEMERRHEHAQGDLSDEKVQKVLSLHEEAEEENQQLRGLLLKKSLRWFF